MIIIDSRIDILSIDESIEASKDTSTALKIPQKCSGSLGKKFFTFCHVFSVGRIIAEKIR